MNKVTEVHILQLCTENGTAKYIASMRLFFQPSNVERTDLKVKLETEGILTCAD